MKPTAEIITNTAEHVAARAVKGKLLIVEDTPEQLAKFVADYTALGYEVFGVLVAKKGAETIEKAQLLGGCSAVVETEDDLKAVLNEQKPDLLLTDGNLDESYAEDNKDKAEGALKDGKHVIEIARGIFASIPKVMHSTSFNILPPTQADIINCEEAGYRPMPKFEPPEVDKYFESLRGAARQI